MKRNKQSTRAMRHRLTAAIAGGTKSRYAQKVNAGNQMYGNGKRCCGHRFCKGTTS